MATPTNVSGGWPTSSATTSPPGGGRRGGHRLRAGSPKVVDLYGGTADPRTGRPWTPQTPVVVFSCTKGILAICAYLLVQQGRLDLDAPVTRYWPEFGQHGKADIPVRWLLTHQSGLPALDRPLSLDEVLGWDPVIKAIEAQAPLWRPGTAHSYHPMTYGWLIGEVIHRITGQLPGAFFRDALATPLGLRTWLGLPAGERDSVAWNLAPAPDPEPFVDPVADGGSPWGARSRSPPTTPAWSASTIRPSRPPAFRVRAR